VDWCSKSTRLERLWTSDGPTAEALGLLDGNAAPLARADQVVLLAAFVFWNGRGELTLAEIVQALDLQATEALTSLLVAVKMEASAIDEWLDAYGVPNEPDPRA
jgi:hypothetical protein